MNEKSSGSSARQFCQDLSVPGSQQLHRRDGSFPINLRNQFGRWFLFPFQQKLGSTTHPLNFAVKYGANWLLRNHNHYGGVYLDLNPFLESVNCFVWSHGRYSRWFFYVLAFGKLRTFSTSCLKFSLWPPQTSWRKSWSTQDCSLYRSAIWSGWFFITVRFLKNLMASWGAVAQTDPTEQSLKVKFGPFTKGKNLLEGFLLIPWCCWSSEIIGQLVEIDV